MGFLYKVHWSERVGLPRPGRTATLIYSAYRPFPAQYHRTTGQCFQIGGVADFDPRNIRYGILHYKTSGFIACVLYSQSRACRLNT
jgi:hypothetical protein